MTKQGPFWTVDKVLSENSDEADYYAVSVVTVLSNQAARKSTILAPQELLALKEREPSPGASSQPLPGAQAVTLARSLIKVIGQDPEGQRLIETALSTVLAEKRQEVVATLCYGAVAAVLLLLAKLEVKPKKNSAGDIEGHIVSFDNEVLTKWAEAAREIAKTTRAIIERPDS